MMTYSEIKDKYPLGCEVRLDEKYNQKDPLNGVKVLPSKGKILAVLDPKKHGPRCLLFKIEKPEGRKISREGARATLMRKAGKGFNGPPHPDRKGKLGIRRTETEEIDLDALAMPADKKGVLKWITPSEVKERVDKKRLKDTEAGRKIQKWIDKNPDKFEVLKPKGMDRTEQLKKILKPGMKVKLKDKATGNWKDGLFYSAGMGEFLGHWTEVSSTRRQKMLFECKDGWNWPLTMIDKVEGEEESDDYWYCERCDEYVHPRSVTYEETHDRCGGEVQPTMSRSLPPSDTIPVPREKVKEAIRQANKNKLEDKCKELGVLDCVFGHKYVNDLLQEIEEEEKYVELTGVVVETGGPSEKPIVSARKGSRHLEVENGYIPEIHKEGGNYVVKFKREG